MNKLAVVLLLMISTKANAWCENQHQVGEVKYKVNSSYFGLLTTKQLDKIASSNAQTKIKADYLMLEYYLDNSELAQISDPKARLERQNYNRWLADRRIKRVKDYLLSKQLQWPVLTRLKTSTKDATRSVFIHSCETQSEPTAFKKLAD